MYSTSRVLYYTVNGIDPRETGGEISGNEVYSYGSPVKINGNGTVKAWVKVGIQWSALTKAKYKFADPTFILTGGYRTKKSSGNFPNPFRSETKIFLIFRDFGIWVYSRSNCSLCNQIKFYSFATTKKHQ